MYTSAGICTLIETNPAAAGDGLLELLLSILSFENPPPQLEQQFTRIIHGLSPAAAAAAAAGSCGMSCCYFKRSKEVVYTYNFMNIIYLYLYLFDFMGFYLSFSQHLRPQMPRS